MVENIWEERYSPEELEAIIASHNPPKVIEGTNTPESWDGTEDDEADDGDDDSVYNAYWAMLHNKR
jgi:hypothetical protein